MPGCYCILNSLYDRFKQWTMGKRPVLVVMLEEQYIRCGEWLNARYAVHCRRLPHYFIESRHFDFLTKGRSSDLDESNQGAAEG